MITAAPPAGITIFNKQQGGNTMTIPGGWEWIVIILVIFILFGGNKAVASLKKAGSEIYKFKKDIDDIKDVTKK